MLTFYRNNYSHLWINLQSNEQLGILDTDFLEDYNGVDGQVSFVRLADSQIYALPMAAISGVTPDTPNDYFRGFIALNTLQDGEYEVRGRVRDLQGNYTIIGSVANPLGGESVANLQIKVLSGSGVRVVHDVSPFTVRGGISVHVARKARLISLT